MRKEAAIEQNSNSELSLPEALRLAIAMHHLNPSGRYSHTEDYLRTVLAEAGLRLLRLESDILRMENARPVAGWIALAERPA